MMPSYLMFQIQSRASALLYGHQEINFHLQVNKFYTESRKGSCVKGKLSANQVLQHSHRGANKLTIDLITLIAGTLTFEAGTVTNNSEPFFDLQGLHMRQWGHPMNQMGMKILHESCAGLSYEKILTSPWKQNGSLFFFSCFALQGIGTNSYTHTVHVPCQLTNSSNVKL